MPLRITTEEQHRRRAVFSATLRAAVLRVPAGRCSLDQYPNRYRHFNRALADAQTPSGAHHAISGTGHEPPPKVAPRDRARADARAVEQVDSPARFKDVSPRLVRELGKRRCAVSTISRRKICIHRKLDDAGLAAAAAL